MRQTLCVSAWISGFEKATKCRRCGKVRGEYFQPVFFLPTKYVLQMPGVIFNFAPARASIPYRSRTIICCPAPQTYRGRKFGFRTLSQRRHLAGGIRNHEPVFGVHDGIDLALKINSMRSIPHTFWYFTKCV